MKIREILTKPSMLIPLLLLTAVAAFPRLYHITSMGIAGWGDNTEYWLMGRNWAMGNITLGQTFRPLLGVLFGGAMKLFGINDYAIKLVTATLSTLTVPLAFITAALVSRSAWIASGSVLGFVFAPGILHYSRTESPHLVSAFFVTLFLLLLVVYCLRQSRENTSRKPLVEYLLLGVSGFTLGCAALTHEELSFLGPAVILFLGFRVLYNKEGSIGVRRFLIESAVFSGGFFLLPIVFILIFSWDTVYTNLTTFTAAKQDIVSPSFFAKLQSRPNILINGPSKYAYVSLYTMYITAFISLAAVSVYKRLYPSMCSTIRPVDYSFYFITLVYIVLWTAFFFSNPGRVYIPLIPATCIAIGVWLHHALRCIRIPYAAIAVFLILILPSMLLQPGSVFNIFIPDHDSKSQDITLGQDIMSYRTTLYKDVHNVLEGKLSYTERMLIASYSIYDAPQFWDVYFPRRFVDYVFSYKSDIPLEDITEHGYIRWLVYPTSQLYPGFITYSESKESAGRAYGFAPGEFTREKEKEYLKRFLKRIDAKKIYSSHNAIIYDLAN